MTILNAMTCLKSRVLKGLLAFALLPVLIVPAAAHTPSATSPRATTVATLSAQIDAQIQQPRFAAAAWGIAVVSLDSGRVLYAHDADRLLQPASTAKLFTAALSLSALGPAYRIPTQLLAAGKISMGRLDGALILRGGGDPTLGTGSSADWAERLASEAAARGLRFVRGELIADDSLFAGPAHGSGWEAQDLQSWFAVPASALSVNENVALLTVTPASAAGRAAAVGVAPQDALPDIQGQLLTSARRSPDNINLYRAPGDGTLNVFGSVAAGGQPRDFKLAMVDPARVAGLQLRQALKSHGIQITGKLRVVHWPQTISASTSGAQVLAEVLSPSVAEILQRGLKRSQNLYLQNLLLTVGARQPTSAQPGFTSTEQLGIRALRRLLDEIGIPPSASLLAEGSGLSRRDLVTPRAMVRLLSFLAAQPYAGTLREALPLAGVDGTLMGHMRRSAAANNLQAKTGSMAYVHCLAGYVTSASGEHLAFAIMLNNYQRADRAPSTSSDVDVIAIMLANYAGTR